MAMKVQLLTSWRLWFVPLTFAVLCVSISSPSAPVLVVPVWALPTATPTPQVILRDDFNHFDTERWFVYTSDFSIGRTRFGGQPAIMTDPDGTRFVRLALDTYHPEFPGTHCRGTEFMSRRDFALENGKEFVARIRQSNVRRGLVAGFYTYGARGRFGQPGYLSDEIDFELLGNLPLNVPLMTCWNDWNTRYEPGGRNDGFHHSSEGDAVPDLDVREWNVYKIRWFNDRIEWYVNDHLVRSERHVLPDEPMHVQFNLWAAAQDWQDAYDADLSLAHDDQATQSYYYDVDYVEVRDIPRGDGITGHGTGLTGAYYNGGFDDDPVLTRTDTRLYFNWGEFSPAPEVDDDNFFVRWTGQVLAQYSEPYTFTIRADDGVRLWVDGQLLVDAWKDQPFTAYTGTLMLQAGRRYDIKVEYYEDKEAAAAQLLWSSPSTPLQPIPQTQLFPR
jgi:hypothetical protein